MLVYGEAAIHYMNGFHLQNVGSQFWACPKTDLPMPMHHRCVPILGLLHHAIGGPSNGSESSPRVAGGARLLEASTVPPFLPSRFLAAFPLVEHYCSNRYLCVPVSIEIVSAAGKTIEKKKTHQAG